LTGGEQKANVGFMTAIGAGAESPPLELPGGVVRGYVPKRPSARISTGNDDLDVLLEGGLPRGGMSEIFGPPSSGRTSIVYALLRSATHRGEAVALIDHSDRFAPRHAESAGVHLSQLLWVRPCQPKETLRCGEILLGTRGFALVIVDLADGFSAALAARSDSVWARLANRAASTRAALVLLSEKRLSGSFAHLCVSFSDPRPLWPRHRLEAPIFAGVEARAEIVRSRNTLPGRSTRIRFDSGGSDADEVQAPRIRERR
jgi:hypothetical protein